LLDLDLLVMPSFGSVFI
jgi:hypothetical protein